MQATPMKILVSSRSTLNHSAQSTNISEAIKKLQFPAQAFPTVTYKSLKTMVDIGCVLAEGDQLDAQ